ncbi:MAG TPA: carboxypeptidase-like regulatory domain-containing protein [Bacteroidia bacterium]|jgi:hypothetical protein|nr:carboxypeptidase-like regulatory domain-containing protein [Bacteroidia bacterium]
MTPSQSNWLDMLKEVYSHLIRNEELISDKPAFVSGVNTLGQLVTSLECLSCHCSAKPGEKTEDRNLKTYALCRLSSSILEAGREYAAYMQDEELEKEFQHSYATLIKLNQEELGILLGRMFDRIQALTPRLAVYGLTGGIIQAWDLLLRTSSSGSKSPRAAMLLHKKMMVCYNQLFKDGLQLCQDFLDPLAATLGKKDPKFHTLYQQKRQVKELTPGNRVQGKVKTKNASSTGKSQTSLEGASLTLVETGVQVHSDSEGNFLFRAVKKGRYSLRAEKEGFYTKTSQPFDLKDGETVTVDFLLSLAEVLQD